jgi:hypothetical protein
MSAKDVKISPVTGFVGSWPTIPKDALLQGV